MTPADFKARRTHLGLSQVRLASELGVSPKTVQSWEQGARNIPKPINLALRYLEMISDMGLQRA